MRDGLLKQRNVETGPTQRNSGRHASDAGADHQGMKTFHRATSKTLGISEDSFETIGRRALSERAGSAMREARSAAEPTADDRHWGLHRSHTLDAGLPPDGDNPFTR